MNCQPGEIGKDETSDPGHLLLWGLPGMDGRVSEPHRQANRQERSNYFSPDRRRRKEERIIGPKKAINLFPEKVESSKSKERLTWLRYIHMHTYLHD